MAGSHVKDRSVRSQLDSFSHNECFMIFCDLSREPWFFLDADRRFLYTNAAFIQLMGLEPSMDVKGYSIEELRFQSVKLHQSMIVHIKNLCTEGSSFMINYFNGMDFLQPYMIYDYPLLSAEGENIGFALNFKKAKLINSAVLLGKVIPRDFTVVPAEPIFTPRELDILFLFLNLMTYKQIAEELQLSVRTVRNHIGRMFYKTEVTSRDEFIIYCKNSHYDVFYPSQLLSDVDYPF